MANKRTTGLLVILLMAIAPTASGTTVVRPTAPKGNVEVPRVMLWQGMYNMWTDPAGVWRVDQQLDDGAEQGPDKYCRKVYPRTVRVVKHQMEYSGDWRNADWENFKGARQSYRCVQR